MTDLVLDVDALVGAVAAGEAVWAMVLRRRPPPRFAWPPRPRWLARWRRQRRRRAGWSPGRLSLHVVPGRVDLTLRGEPIASLAFP